MFRAADVILLTKTDLLPVLDDFHPELAESYVRQLANPAPVLQLSAKRGAGMEAWLTWLRQEVAAQRQRIAQGFTARPAQQPDAIYSPPDPHHQHSHAA
jgi:hydrogenase nickel incorporation protein HypB